MDSILTSVKKMLGIPSQIDHFDADIVMHINSVFLILNQLGVGPKTPYSITGIDETWNDFFIDTEPIDLVKSYMYLKVRLIFDPPTTGVLHEAMERQITEFEWRLNIQVEGGVTVADSGEYEDENSE